MDKVKQLREELEVINAHAKEVSMKLQDAEQVEESYTTCLHAGKQLKAAVNGLVDAGFNEDQAFELVLLMVDKAASMPLW